MLSEGIYAGSWLFLLWIVILSSLVKVIAYLYAYPYFHRWIDRIF